MWAQHVRGLEAKAPATSAVHPFMVLAFFTGGSAVLRQRGELEARAGDVYLVPAGERHGVVTTRAPEAWSLGFFPSCYAATELAPLLDPFERVAAGASPVVGIPASRHAHLAGLLAELHRETTATGPSVPLVHKSLLALVLAEVARAAGSTTTAGPRPGLVADALRFIERRCLGPLSLRDVAAAVGRSGAHVSTSVRQATGRSVTEWITAGRLSEARNRLLHTDERIDAIAERVGYADPTHFIRAFRRAHGTTPAAWRAGQRGASAPRPSRRLTAAGPTR